MPADASRVYGRIPTCASAASPRPFSHRTGSATLRSNASAARVVTRSPVDPIDNRISSRSSSRANASRTSRLRSTLVVPDSTRTSRSASGSRSARAYTPQHDENDSSRKRPSPLVRIGSNDRAEMGRKYLDRATAATASNSPATNRGCATQPSKNGSAPPAGTAVWPRSSTRKPDVSATSRDGRS